MRSEQFWATTFAFAVSSSYLGAQEFVDVRASVVRCVQDFAGYMGGTGIPGEKQALEPERERMTTLYTAWPTCMSRTCHQGLQVSGLKHA